MPKVHYQKDTATKGRAHYIDNKNFLEALKKHRTEVRRATRLKTEVPPLSEYIGECFIKIATNMSYRPNFNNYTFLDEMISDGIENCLIYANNFDPRKSTNAFAYFSQIVWYAFVRRIQKEKRQLNTKYRYIETLGVDDIIRQAHDEGDYETPYIDYLKNQISLASIELHDEVKKDASMVKRPKYMSKTKSKTKTKTRSKS